MIRETITSNTLDEEAQVCDLYRQLMDAWNRGSAEAFGAAFAEDGEQVAFDGYHYQGRKEIIAGHRPLFEKWMKGSRLVGQVKNVRFLTPDVAVVQAVGGTIMRGAAKPSPERDSIQTMVAVRAGGEWKLAALHNTRLRPIGGGFASILIWGLTDLLWKLVIRRSLVEGR